MGESETFFLWFSDLGDVTMIPKTNIFTPWERPAKIPPGLPIKRIHAFSNDTNSRIWPVSPAVANTIQFLARRDWERRGTFNERPMFSRHIRSYETVLPSLQYIGFIKGVLEEFSPNESAKQCLRMELSK